MKPKNKPGDVIRGILPLIYIVINLSIWIVPLVLLALLKLVIPFQAIKKGIYQLMIGIYFLAVELDVFLFSKILNIRFDVDPINDLKKDKTYLVVTNHKSWADILIYQSILIRHIPIIKFIVKKELLYVPLIGLICWAYDYPLVERRSFKPESKRNKKEKPCRKDDLDVRDT